MLWLLLWRMFLLILVSCLVFEFSSDGGLNWGPWTGIYGPFDLVSGEVRTFLIRGTLLSGATGVLVNRADA